MKIDNTLIIDLLNNNQFDILEKYLCCEHKAIFTPELYEYFARETRYLSEDDITNFAQILDKRYANIKNFNEVKSELPFWEEYITILHTSPGIKFPPLTSTIQNIIQKIQEN